jgi:hypothetical protein
MRPTRKPRSGGGFFEDWYAVHQDKPVGVAELWPFVFPSNSAPLELGLGDGPEHSLKSRFGRRLRQQKDRQIGFLRLVSAGISHGAQQWRLVPAGVATVQTVSAAPPTVGLQSIADVLDDPSSLSEFDSGTVSSTSPPSPSSLAVAPTCGEGGEVGELSARETSNVESASATSQPVAEFPFPTRVVCRLSGMGYSDEQIRKMHVEDSLRLLVKAGCSTLGDV